MGGSLLNKSFFRLPSRNKKPQKMAGLTRLRAWLTNYQGPLPNNPVKVYCFVQDKNLKGKKEKEKKSISNLTIIFTSSSVFLNKSFPNSTIRHVFDVFDVSMFSTFSTYSTFLTFSTFLTISFRQNFLSNWKLQPDLLANQ